MTTIQTANSHTITQEQINAIIQKRQDSDPTILDRLRKEITPDCFYKGQDDDLYFTSPRKPDFDRAEAYVSFTTPDGNSHTSLTTATDICCGLRYAPPIYEQLREDAIFDALRAYAGDDYLEQRLLAFIWSEVSRKPAYFSDLNNAVRICRYFAENEPSVSLPYPLQWLKSWRPKTMSEAGRQKLLAIADRFDKLKADIQAAYDLIPDAQTIDFSYTPPNPDDDVPF